MKSKHDTMRRIYGALCRLPLIARASSILPYETPRANTWRLTRELGSSGPYAMLFCIGKHRDDNFVFKDITCMRFEPALSFSSRRDVCPDVSWDRR